MRLNPRILPAAVLLGALHAGVAAATLEEVRDRDRVRCGVDPDLAGFSEADSLGRYRGFDVDLCRAVAAAVLGDAEAVELLPLEGGARREALAARDVDLLAGGVVWTLEQDARLGELTTVGFHDGQGFLVGATYGVRSALELEGASVCVAGGGSHERALERYFARNALRFRPMPFDGVDGALAAYADGACPAVSASRSRLAAHRAGTLVPRAHVLLPETVTKEPRGPLVRENDPRWESIVRWSLGCLINAEELGVDSALARRADITDPPASPGARRLLGIDGDAGAALGIRSSWCAEIVRQLGHYGEVYARHLGPETPLGLERGVNALWTDGGLIHAPPLR